MPPELMRELQLLRLRPRVGSKTSSDPLQARGADDSASKAGVEVLPEPIYPIHPDPQPMTKSEYQNLNAIRTWKTWGSPISNRAGTETICGRSFLICH